ncbi:RhoGAP domain protein [Paragonimus skrjabini miyazakii]|uniref:RhoGAP domain protein n=1 Tax=Paragonimus skrjabini miyazakii TaxID=59628 RepID=A0A8S9YSC6_9TREM|nr:RhoGAP domain protein [Paragonimus skrjabini miyazakii]
MAVTGTLVQFVSSSGGTELGSLRCIDKLSLGSHCFNESDTSGFVSCTASTCTSASDRTTLDYSPETVNESSGVKISSRRCSSGQKLAKFINALTPCRGRTARRSYSFGNVTTANTMNPQWNNVSYPKPNLVYATSQFDISHDGVHPAAESTGDIYSKPEPGFSTCATQLDQSTVKPTVEAYEFRRRWPASFVALVTNYLGFLLFTPDDIDQVRDALTKEARYTTPMELTSAATAATYRAFTPQKNIRSREIKNYEKDLEHWYVVINTVLHYLLEDERYKHRFILRRPGNHSNVNGLERILFPPRHRPLSMSLKSRCTDHPDERLHHPAMVSEITDVLNRFDAPVIACFLARVLRRHGVGLIPVYLRRLFLQLVSGVKENEAHQRRAIRLLFQLVSRRMLHSVIQPLFELLAHIANEPACEVDESSLAVLFSPVFFLDRATTTPAALANPLPVRVVQLFVGFARRELQTNQSVSRLFQVPILFQDDCVRNLRLYMTCVNPPLSCGLKYCVTMTPSPRSQGKKPDVIPSVSITCPNSKSMMPIVNLTSTFMAKRSRQRSPFVLGDYTTPVLKNALHSPTLDFRVRRTPTSTFARNQCLQVVKHSAACITPSESVKRTI